MNHPLLPQTINQTPPDLPAQIRQNFKYDVLGQVLISFLQRAKIDGMEASSMVDAINVAGALGQGRLLLITDEQMAELEALLAAAGVNTERAGRLEAAYANSPKVRDAVKHWEGSQPKPAPTEEVAPA